MLLSLSYMIVRDSAIPPFADVAPVKDVDRLWISACLGRCRCMMHDELAARHVVAHRPQPCRSLERRGNPSSILYYLNAFPTKLA